MNSDEYLKILTTININFHNLYIYKVNHFGSDSQLTQLVTCLENVDPDDSFSSIPYEKGHMLLCYLEDILGGCGKCLIPNTRSQFGLFQMNILI